MLELYRSALQIRRDHAALGDGSMTWLALPPGVLGFRREPGFGCVVNMGTEPIALADLPIRGPNGAPPVVLLASEQLISNRIPSDVAVWFTIDTEDAADSSD
jgi:alpha-glucosidase